MVVCVYLSKLPIILELFISRYVWLLVVVRPPELYAIIVTGIIPAIRHIISWKTGENIILSNFGGLPIYLYDLLQKTCIAE